MLDARFNMPVFEPLGLKKIMRRLSFLKPFFILSLALIFLVSSIGGGLFAGESWAAKGIAGLTSVGPDNAGGPTPLKELNAGTFTMPKELGYVQEAAKLPDSTKTVIHIQDAHCNYAAQKQIANILHYLTGEYGVDAVNCEGGAEDYDLSPFTGIPEKDIREKTSDFFVKEGVVSAAEFFAVNNPGKVKLWGVEDADLYIKNLKVYKESLVYKDKADRYIKSISYILDNLKRHIYSPELLDFDSYYMKHKDNKISFKEYITYLIKAAKNRMVDIKSFPNIYLLGQTLEEEDIINFKKANNEKDEVVDKLKKVLSKNELKELISKAGQMKIERISQGDFYSYLVKKCNSIKLDLKNYPELEKYTVYISIYSAIDRTKITEEIDDLEDRIKETLYENDTQRELGILSKNIILEKNMFNISLTRDDYTYYKQHSASFEVSNFLSFIEAKAPLYKIQASFDSNISMLDVYREKMEAFYECSLERDKAFIKNIKFTDHTRPSSIIITGGFHTQNLRELFKKENVSYISIMPKFTNPPGYESPYLKRLAGQRTALENVIDTAIPAVLNLQVVEILSKLGKLVEGESGMIRFRNEVALVAMSERIKKLIEEGKQVIIKADKTIPVKEGKKDEDKIIIFTKGEGGNITHSVISQTDTGFKELSRQAEWLLGRDSATNTVMLAQMGKAVSVVPQTKAAESQPQTPIAVVQAEKPVVAKTEAEQPYESAVNPARGVASVIRKNTATRIVTLVASEEDKNVVAGLGLTARKLVGTDTDIHLNSYVAEDEWVPKLRDLLEIELKNFVESDMKKRAPLMEIRVKEGKDTRQIVDQMIEDILTRLGYRDNIKNIKSRIRFVQVRIEPDKHTNPAIEFFVDLGMLECDRYINGDYDRKDMPSELGNHFLALLKLSIKNASDFNNKSIDEILGMIFAGHLLQIKPADFKSFDEWNRINRQLMQSV